MGVVTERARVAAVDADGNAWLETQRQTACGSCRLQQGCGTGVLSKLFSERGIVLRAPNHIGARVGDEVLIGIDDRMLVRASIAAYLMPLVWMLLGGIGGRMIGDILLWPAADAVSALGGLAGLAFGFLWLRRHARHGYHQPRLIDFAADDEVVARIAPEAIPARRLVDGSAAQNPSVQERP